MKKYTFKLYLLLLIFFPVTLHSQQQINRFDSLEMVVNDISYLQKQKSLELIREMYTLASNRPDSSFFFSRTYYTEALLNFRQGISDSLLVEKINKRLSENIDMNEQIILKSALSFCITAAEDYTDAFNLSLQVSENAKNLGDSLLMARSLNHLGNICKEMSLNTMAENYYRDALKWVEHSHANSMYSTILINLYSLYLYMNDRDDRKEIVGEMEGMIDTLSNSNVLGLLSILYINISNSYLNEDKEHDKALFYLLKSKELHEDNSYRQALISYNLGMYYLYINKDYKTALNYFQEAQQYWEKNSNYRLLSVSYKDFSNLYEAMNMPDSALYCERKSAEYMNLNNSNLKIVETHQKYILTSLEASENKLDLAQSKINLKNKQFVIILISSISILLISILFVIFLLQKRKSMRQQVLLKEAETKELETRFQQEQIIQKEKEESKLREITSYSLLLSNKNEMLNKILEVTEAISSPSEIDNKKKIETIINENVRMENDWNDFVIHFERVHPRFFEKIRDLYPDISQGEIKLMAYIRIGISTKQISQMLNVTPESIRTSRYRLKKKLNIEKDESLDDFIHSL